MTDKHTTEYLEKFGSIKMSSDVKARMRDDLSSFADFHTVVDTEVVSKKQNIPTFLELFARPVGVLFIVLLIVGTGSISFVANNMYKSDLSDSDAVSVGEDVQTTRMTAPANDDISIAIPAQDTFAPSTPVAMRAKSADTNSVEDISTMSMKMAAPVSLPVTIRTAEKRIEGIKLVLSTTPGILSKTKVQMIAKLETGAKFIADAHALASTSPQTPEVEIQTEMLLGKGTEVINIVENSLSMLGQLEFDPVTGAVIKIIIE